MTVHECWRAAQPTPAIPPRLSLSNSRIRSSADPVDTGHRLLSGTESSPGPEGGWAALPRRHIQGDKVPGPVIRKVGASGTETNCCDTAPDMPRNTTSCICSSLSSPWATTRSTSPKEPPGPQAGLQPSCTHVKWELCLETSSGPDIEACHFDVDSHLRNHVCSTARQILGGRRNMCCSSSLARGLDTEAK